MGNSSNDERKNCLNKASSSISKKVRKSFCRKERRNPLKKEERKQFFLPFKIEKRKASLYGCIPMTCVRKKWRSCLEILLILFK